MKFSKKQKREAIRIALSAVLLIAAVTVDKLLLPESDKLFSREWLFGLLCYLPAFAVAGGETLASAVSNIFRGQIFDENFLMSVAAVAAFVLGEFTEGVAVMLFSDVGELFESCATGNARGAIDSLAKLCPDKADVVRDGKIVTVPADEVAVGEIIEVGAGRRIAIDGVVEEGNASIDCSSLTGESLPVAVSVGDKVSSGTVNIDGRLRIRTTCTSGASAAAKIVETVEDAAAGKSKTEAFITKFAAWYTPAVCAAAVITAVAFPLILHQPFMTWVYRALSFLVVSCPCALVISVPLTFFGAVGGSAKKGILFKDNSKIELLANMKNVAFDKTGTLTKGVLSVDGIHVSSEDFDGKKLLEYAAAAEFSSLHPLASAITRAYGKTIDSTLLSDIHEIPGRGRSVVYNGKTVAAGNTKLLEDIGVRPEELSDVAGETAVHLAVDGRYVGSITFRDELKPTSAEAISSLEHMGVRTVMLSGDSQAVADRVAGELGISECKASLLPEDKLKELKNLISEGVTGFVGDGINDSPSLARADVGFAMGKNGADIAIDAADVVISSDDPIRVPDALRIARKTMRIAKENIVFAIAVKLISLALIGLGIVGMWMAVVADVGVSVVAILNASRMLSKDDKTLG